MDRPSIRQLECLVGVADQLSFRRAADTLGISQPALSAQVQLAEQLLGIQVFERDRRSVLVTPAGEDVIGRAREALVAVDAVAEAPRRRDPPLGAPPLVGVLPARPHYSLPLLLPPLPTQHPPPQLILR